ncbi:MAG: protein-L-isoaspartate(D-aspartate) O-methyltransferase [Stellaceae bacterium]
MPFDFASRKLNLLAELREMGIGDERVLAAMAQVQRELFVPDTFHDRAYDNTPLPIGRDQTISQPYIVALMTEALQLEDRHCVLEIGTGSGYQAAVLARLARRVFTIERHRPLLQVAEARFATLRLHNITTRFGDGTKGWPEAAPFDRIIVTAAAPEVPLKFVAQLREGGIMLVPVGRERHDQRLIRLHCTAEGYEVEELGLVRFVPLVRGLPRVAASTRME